MKELYGEWEDKRASRGEQFQRWPGTTVCGKLHVEVCESNRQSLATGKLPQLM